MSASEEKSSKKICLNIDQSVSNDSKSVAKENDNNTNQVDFRDLIFSVTGTVPQSFDSNTGSTACGLVGSGAAIACEDEIVSNVEQKRKVPYSRRDNGKEEIDMKGTIAYLTDAAENKSDETAVLSEADVGITEFISQHEGFSGILKQRYSDFVVNEINKSGEIVHLTDINPPPRNFITDAAADEEETTLKDLLSEEQLTQIHKLTESKSEVDEVTVAVSCKTVRGKLHRLIKSSFPDLDCNTVEKDGEKLVVVKYFTHKGGEQRARVPFFFTKATGNYCKFVLCKENCDTQYAISIIAKCLHVHQSNFGYAGTKDRRAKTSQEVTVHRVTPLRLHQVSRGLRNIILGNFSICKEPLKLGDLTGNRFVVVLRNVTGSDEQIESGMKSLRDVGFINYYGMQRFGTTRISTHSIGQALLQGAWSEAIELIMKPREGDRYEMIDARTVWQETHDANKTLEALRGYHCNERQLLEGLKRSAENDFVGALSFIPRNMRLMYIHAYQSYIWNRVVSRRIRELGLVPQPGDLVFQGKLDEPASAMSDDTQVPSARVEPILLTEDNVASYSISDVVLPLPGYDVRYPENESGAWYKELLIADGMEDCNFRNKIKDYSLPGSYRKIVVKPDSVSWEVIRYDNYLESLVESDFDRARRRDTPTFKVEQTGDGKLKALKIEMSLPTSSYATMAVREVLKCGTSAAFQTTLNTT